MSEPHFWTKAAIVLSFAALASLLALVLGLILTTVFG